MPLVYKITCGLTWELAHYNQSLVQSEPAGDRVPCLMALGQKAETMLIRLGLDKDS